MQIWYKINRMLQQEELHLERWVHVYEAGGGDGVVGGRRAHVSTPHQKRSSNSNASAVTVLTMYKHTATGIQCALNEIEGGWEAVEEELSLAVDGVNCDMLHACWD